MSGQLTTIVTSSDPAIRNRSLDAFCRAASLAELLAECAELDALRRSSQNLYERGWVLVTSENLIKLRELLHQTADYLLGFDDPLGLDIEERLLLDLFRQTRNTGLRNAILDYARLQHDFDRRESKKAASVRPAKVEQSRRK